MPRAFKIKLVIESHNKSSCSTTVTLLRNLLQEYLTSSNVVVKCSGVEIPYKSTEGAIVEMAKGGEFCLAKNGSFTCTKQIGHKDILHVAHDYAGRIVNKWK